MTARVHGGRLGGLGDDDLGGLRHRGDRSGEEHDDGKGGGAHLRAVYRRGPQPGNVPPPSRRLAEDACPEAQAGLSSDAFVLS